MKIVNSLDLLTIFAIRFTIDVSHVSESASVSYQTVALEIFVVGAILNQQNFTVYRKLTENIINDVVRFPIFNFYNFRQDSFKKIRLKMLF